MGARWLDYALSASVGVYKEDAAVVDVVSPSLLLFLFISPTFQSLSHQHTAASEALHSEALQPHHLATMSASTTASHSHKALVGGDCGAAVPHRA